MTSNCTIRTQVSLEALRIPTLMSARHEWSQSKHRELGDASTKSLYHDIHRIHYLPDAEITEYLALHGLLQKGSKSPVSASFLHSLNYSRTPICQQDTNGRDFLLLKNSTAKLRSQHCHLRFSNPPILFGTESELLLCDLAFSVQLHLRDF
ncbi:Hypothetical predicted protein [Podarcis lilfordi]|uniref:Uncharacterized protein n=1 Tax=Podarcis lilfordi TaxID=74358 RepID=A0AA35PLQ4_9SAUR|nr:Hypothetical predicted protein [Podarcis lilfordi]